MQHTRCDFLRSGCVHMSSGLFFFKKLCAIHATCYLPEVWGATYPLGFHWQACTQNTRHDSQLAPPPSLIGPVAIVHSYWISRRMKGQHHISTQAATPARTTPLGHPGTPRPSHLSQLPLQPVLAPRHRTDPVYDLQKQQNT